MKNITIKKSEKVIVETNMGINPGGDS